TTTWAIRLRNSRAGTSASDASLARATSSRVTTARIHPIGITALAAAAARSPGTDLRVATVSRRSKPTAATSADLRGGTVVDFAVGGDHPRLVEVAQDATPQAAALLVPQVGIVEQLEHGARRRAWGGDRRQRAAGAQ